MLPRAEPPARQLPYTTADMGERLAKKKAEQEAAAQAQANQALRFGVTNPPAVKKDEPWYRDALGAVGGAIKSAYEWLPNEMPSTTPINMGGDAGVLMGSQGTPKSLVLEPARLAVRRAVGDITAIPRVGEPSPSYTADQIRDQGVALGVLGAAIDYSQFIPIVAKGAGFTGDAVNAYKLAMMERQANPFPALRGASNVIDVVPGSRLPARIVEPPTPATRLGESLAQRTLDARAAQGGVRDAGVIRFPGGEPTPELPSAQLSQPAFRERNVPESTNITVQTSGNPDIQKRQTFTIRAFDKGFNDFKGVLTMHWDPDLQKAVVDDLAATSPMVTPQLISSAAYLIRKTYGDIPFPIEPSTNLSAYSRPFVERLQQAGLVDPSYYLPPKESINKIDRETTPYDISDPDTRGQKVIPPLAYQPTYNQVLKALVESKRRAKLQGEYGRLTTPSTKLAPKRNSLINEMVNIEAGFDPWRRQPSEIDEISDFDEPVNLYQQQQFSTVEQARNDAVLNNIEEPAALKPLDNNELQNLVNRIYSIPSFMAIDLIKYAKQNDPATNLFDAVNDIPGYLERMGLINELHRDTLTAGLDRQLALINRPVRIAEFIRNNVDPNNPLLNYYLDQYGSIENFANSDESFSFMEFMRPFYRQEPL